MSVIIRFPMLTESFFVAPVCRRNETGMRIDMLVRTPTREGKLDLIDYANNRMKYLTAVLIKTLSII